MSDYINPELRRLISDRADHLCEYCLIHEDDSFFGFEADHIISLKHGGLTEANNLAYACTFCNRLKGSDIGSIYWQTKQFYRFFNPRIDKWFEHFQLNGAVIESITEIGEVTARILRFNNSDRILEREALIEVKRYPIAEALKRMIR